MQLLVAGLITAGEPIEAIEDKTETMTVPKELVGPSIRTVYYKVNQKPK